MDKITLQLPAGAFVVMAVAGLVTTFAVKYFAPALAWWQAFLVSLVSAGAALLFLITYTFLSGTLFPEWIDSLAVVATFAVMGTLITLQARAYGVEKTGFVGVGGRSVLALLAFSVAAIAILSGEGDLGLRPSGRGRAEQSRIAALHPGYAC